ncbi:hypothetical protein KFK09_000338 [Dendrobium nobile]|uniref:Uncharacterized protein n=1 Tax=Dendrobium nobile TaxID=94219 RepID=A0A8T3CEG5_DENNO|nr:hypothetical protein KFK09_000338 [Dendrobium nobile]
MGNSTEILFPLSHISYVLFIYLFILIIGFSSWRKPVHLFFSVSCTFSQLYGNILYYVYLEYFFLNYNSNFILFLDVILFMFHVCHQVFDLKICLTYFITGSFCLDPSRNDKK